MIGDSNSARTDPLWAHFFSNPSVADDEVHVWLADLDDPGVHLDRCAQCLSPAERARAAQFKLAVHRQHYLIAHGALRSILGMYLGVAAAVIDFDSGPAGKPRLARNLSSGGLEFNLSHSGGFALIAVARGREVGIDVERIKEDFPFQSVAQRFFTRAEVTALEKLPRPLQRETFYRCWTSKEALLKAQGIGLNAPLEELQIVLTATGVRITPLDHGWGLTEVSPIHGYAAVLGLKASQHRLECYRWKASALPGAVRPERQS